MWLRLGVQTDFSLTNTTGIRADLNPGPITIEEMYNIFPFDNSISKMQLSGLEVQQLFDYVARRSSNRGCVAQGQIAGARVRLNCAGCSRADHVYGCNKDDDCPTGTPGACDRLSTGSCGFDHTCRADPCAEEVYIGFTDKTCDTDADCASPTDPSAIQCQPPPANCPSGTEQNGQCVHAGQCFKAVLGQKGKCQSIIAKTNLYELATSNYLAGGGSGYRVLQRNTTQFDTLIQQRDALNDYLRQGKPCGYNKDAGTPEGLKACSVDADCGNSAFVCACPAHAHEEAGTPLSCKSDGQCDPAAGRCVLAACRDQVADFHDRVCAASPAVDRCKIDLNACSLAGEECKFLSCVDQTLGNLTDNRLEMLGR
jgi:5'-nucleotidase